MVTFSTNTRGVAGTNRLLPPSNTDFKWSARGLEAVHFLSNFNQPHCILIELKLTGVFKYFNMDLGVYILGVQYSLFNTQAMYRTCAIYVYSGEGFQSYSLIV